MSQRKVELSMPPVRHADLPELKFYTITEDELSQLERGSDAGQWFQFGAPVFAFGLGLVATLLCSTPRWELAENVLWAAAFGTTCAGAGFLWVWSRERKKAPAIAKRIRARLKEELLCPKCSGKELLLSPGEDSWLCRHCGAVWAA